jgi:hypothetical protein
VVNPRDRLRSAGKRNPVEAIAQQVTERVVDLLVSALDVNELAARIDLNVPRSPSAMPLMIMKIGPLPERDASRTGTPGWAEWRGRD